MAKRRQPHIRLRFAARQSIPNGPLAASDRRRRWAFAIPVQMLPLLLFELTWKAIYLVAFGAAALASAPSLPPARLTSSQFLMVVILVPLIPWTYVWKHYVMHPGDRWR